MKVRLNIYWAKPGYHYHGVSEIIDWPYDILPKPGDTIDVGSDDDSNPFKMTYHDNESAEMIPGSDFKYQTSHFCYEKGVPFLEFVFGEEEE